jgi:pyruvate formate lyase activating enzyme
MAEQGIRTGKKKGLISSEKITEKSEVMGYVHSVETGGMADGPGVRYIIFMSGCPLRCQYCHNPDMLHMKDGKLTSATQLLDDISRYASYLNRSKGGVTLSGGEPMVQPDFVKAIFKGCKEMGIHTTLDTSGYLNKKADDDLLDLTDLVLLDIKSGIDRIYKEVTGRPLQPTLSFAERLAKKGIPIWLRYVLVPGLTDGVDNIEEVASFAASLNGTVQRVDVLPFHKMGEKKWEHTNLDYKLTGTGSPTHEQIAAARNIFKKYGLIAY